jgi:replication factor C subunit 3/5
MLLINSMDKEKVLEYLNFTYEDVINESKVCFNKELIERFKNFSTDNEMPHIIFYGLAGSGKKTMVNILLELLFGKDIYNISEKITKINGSGGKQNEVITSKSKYHIIIKPNNNNFDRHMVKELIKEYAKTFLIKDNNTVNKTFKVIQINKIDMLSENAQNSLKRTIEKYSRSCRFVSYCTSLNKIIEPLRSRCLCLNVKNMSVEQNENYLNQFIVKENLSIPENIIRDIIIKSDGNIKESIWNLYFYTRHDHLNDFYTLNIFELYQNIIKNCNIEKIREIIYKLTIQDISENKICKDIFVQLLENYKNNKEVCLKIIQLIYEYELNICKARRPIKIIEHIFLGLNDIIQKSKKKI